MAQKFLWAKSCVAVCGVIAMQLPSAPPFSDLTEVRCESPPLDHCGVKCDPETLAAPGNAIERKTGRKFFLDYPCDLRRDQKVLFILNLHGAGSSANWQRHYFPAMDFTEKYRLIVATPAAATLGYVGPMPGVRIWVNEVDAEYLRNITDFVFERIGSDNIKAFWLVGHSQGSLMASRLLCTDYFADKVDGWLSLSGGRLGPVEIAPDLHFMRAESDEDAPEPGAANAPDCDFSYIFATGENEIAALPRTSPWADKYHCHVQTRQRVIFDTVPGYVSTRRPVNANAPASAQDAGLGVAEVFTFPQCDRDRLVADVVRRGKNHSDGLEPKITDALIRLMLAAPGNTQRD